jgi:UDP-N-acetyl-D-glucosamine dehydrogenase
MSLKVAIVGQGYVGLPLAMAAVGAGNSVIGIDRDAGLVASLSSGVSVIEDVSDSELASALKNGYSVSSSFVAIGDCSVLVICVPTPLDEAGAPDISILIGAVNSVASVVKPGVLVIVESTVATGTIRKVIAPILEAKLGVGNFDLVYSPERIDPLNRKWEVKNTPKLAAGLSEVALSRAVSFYSSFVSSVVPGSSVEVIETAKLLENSFRFVNISFINEISVLCDALGIDVLEVIDAAASKPYGFMPFYPGAGVGGHCIPVDPIYLASAARDAGSPSRFIELARDINSAMPAYFVGRAVAKLGTLSDKAIIVIGVAYKANVSDTRESAAEKLIDLLRGAGAIVSWHDDLVGTWRGEESSALSASFDLAILVTPHDGLDMAALGSVPVINTRGGAK